MARRVSIDVVLNPERVNAGFKSISRSAAAFDHNITRTARGAVAASLSFRGLGRAAAYASGYLLGGAGIAYGLKRSVENSESLEKAQRSLAVVIQRNGGNFKQQLPTIEKFAAAQARFGVSTVQAEQGLARATVITGSAQKGMRAYTEALEIAKATGRSFNTVLLAAAKANEGQTTALARYIGKIPKGTSALELFTRIQAKYLGQAQANTLATDKLGASLTNIETLVGNALLPTIDKYSSKLADWLGKSKNQERIQKDVATAVHGLTDALKTAKTVIKDVDDVTGGFKRTLELLLALKVVSTLHSWTKALAEFEIVAGAGGSGGAVKTATTLGAKLREIAQIGVLSVGLRFPGLGAALSKIPILRGQLTKLALIKNIAIPVTIAITADFVGKKLGENTDFSPSRFLKEGLGGLNPLKNKGPLLNFILGNGFKSDNAPQKLEDTSLSASKGLGPHSASLIAKQIKDAVATANIAVKKAGLTSQQRNTFFDNAISRILLRGGLGNIQQQIAALQKADTLIQQRLKVTKDVTRRLNLEDQLLQNAAQIKSLNAQATADSLQKRQDVVSEFIANLQLGVTKAQTTSQFKDDLSSLKALENGIKSEIKEFGRTADLAGQLFDVQQQLKQTQQRRISAKEFFTLGLGPTGDVRVPLKGALKKRLGTLSEAVKGTFLDTKKTQSEFANIRKALSNAIVPTDVRANIKEMFDEIRQELDKGGHELTKFKHVNGNAFVNALGLNLTPEEKRRLRQAISTVGAGGTVPGSHSVAFSGQGAGGHGDVYLDGKKVGRVITPIQRRAAQRRSESRRGPYAGRN